MYEDVFSILVFLLIVSFVLRFISWMMVTDTQTRPSFWLSFIKYYSIYQFHDAPSRRTVQFWKLCNFVNIIFWICLLGIGFYALNIAFKAPIN